MISQRVHTRISVLGHGRTCRGYHPLLHRRFATVEPTTVIAPPPRASDLSVLDTQILAALSSNQRNLSELIGEYTRRSSSVLDRLLSYESRPSDQRRIDFNCGSDDEAVVMIVHCVKDGENHQMTMCSGFALGGSGNSEKESLVLTCAHTLEEIKRSPLLHPERAKSSLRGVSENRLSGSFVISGSGESLSIHRVSAVLSAVPRSDLVLLSNQDVIFKTLPVSPYPPQPHTLIRAHFVTRRPPDEPGWRPWVGGLWSKWARGTVLGYRDFAGRETQPGTYDALSHLLFHPPPPAGSSGGPIVDEESGAVVGVVLGTRADNPAEGLRGWGVPSEAIFEMFGLPGLT